MKLKQHNDKYVVKVSQLKLEASPGILFGANNHNKVVICENDKNNNLAIRVKGRVINKERCFSSSTWKNLIGPFFSGISKRGKSTHTTSPRKLNTFDEASTITWDLCGFELLFGDGFINDASLCIEFHILHGEGCDTEENKPKMVVVGKASMEELLVREDANAESNLCHLQRTLPIPLLIHGLCIESTLSISLSIFESQKQRPQFISETVKHFMTSLVKKKTNAKFDQEKEPSNPNYESDVSTEFDSDNTSIESTTSSSSGSSHSKSAKINYSRSIFSWNRNLRGLWSPKTLASNVNPCPILWEHIELWSRDGHAKLETNVSFASFDQRSKEASGESACSALAVFISHWLHSHKEMMPTKVQFDKLIIQGSAEWRRLCGIHKYLSVFPDKHFNLETVLDANLRPLIIRPQKSYTGFFSPEKFQCLKGAMSFEEIWDEMNQNNGIYIVGWKEHFFVLKIGSNDCYLIDTFGERLFEGCQKGFILKFDGSSLMQYYYSRVDKAEEDERLEIVCSGKECCKEFIKLFLAAIPIRQLEEMEKEKVLVSDPYYLHRILQIDVHYSSPS